MMLKTLFRDRLHSGEQLAEVVAQQVHQLQFQHPEYYPVIYALPRGGIQVALPIARKLGCPINVIVAKKITLSHNRELAIGAVTAKGTVLWCDRDYDRSQMEKILDLEKHYAQEKAQTQHQILTSHCPPRELDEEIAILVDDGIATGMTMRVAIQEAKTISPVQVWVCTPVAPPELVSSLEQECHNLIILQTPSPFGSVSRFYQRFPQIPMEDACQELRHYNQQFAPG